MWYANRMWLNASWRQWRACHAKGNQTCVQINMDDKGNFKSETAARLLSLLGMGALLNNCRLYRWLLLTDWHIDARGFFLNGSWNFIFAESTVDSAHRDPMHRCQWDLRHRRGDETMPIRSFSHTWYHLRQYAAWEVLFGWAFGPFCYCSLNLSVVVARIKRVLKDKTKQRLSCFFFSMRVKRTLVRPSKLRNVAELVVKVFSILGKYSIQLRKNHGFKMVLSVPILWWFCSS